MGELQPVGAAPSGTVSGRESFADDTFQTLLQCCGQQRAAVVIGRWHLSVGAAETDALQGCPSLRQRLAGEIDAMQTQEVEDHEDDGPGGRQADRKSTRLNS